MKSGGSSSGGGGKTVIPKAPVTEYGSASPFNPQYTSFLPQNAMASAQLGDQPRIEYGAPTPLLKQQEAVPMVAPASSSASSGISDPMKRFLADLMARSERKRYLAGVNRESAGGGSQAMGSFGSGGNSGSSKGGGLY